MQAEYSLSVIKEGLLGENVDTNQLLQDFYEEIAAKVSLDQETISINQFELLTRKHGFKSSLETIL